MSVNKLATGNSSGANIFYHCHSAKPETFFIATFRANVVPFIHDNYSQYFPLSYHQATEKWTVQMWSLSFMTITVNSFFYSIVSQLRSELFDSLITLTLRMQR